MVKRTTAVPTPSYRGPGEASRLRRLIWAVAKCMGIRGQQWLWNNQFRGGYWNHIGQKKNEETVAYVKKYLLGGRLVEFGCGEGLLPQALGPQTYQSYEGLDISRVAIERARSRNLPNCTFKVCRLEDWPGDREVSLCVAEEVLYYLKPDDQRRLLAKCLSSLTPEGSILVIVHDKVLHAATLDLVRSCGAVREEREINGRSIVVIGPR